MRILAITPIHVTEDELARRQARYDRLAPRGVTVRLENLGGGSDVPGALNTADEIAASEAMLVERFEAADTTGVDAFLPDCVLDPVVEHQSTLRRPVFGIARLSAHFIAGFGARLGAVARNVISAELDRKLKTYGLPLHRPIAVMDLPVEAIADDTTWAAALEHTVGNLDCDFVINACSAVDVTASGVGPLVLDPTQTALQLITLHASVVSV
jgi:Asp/Glu/hydantoin racemase